MFFCFEYIFIFLLCFFSHLSRFLELGQQSWGGRSDQPQSSVLGRSGLWDGQWQSWQWRADLKLLLCSKREASESGSGSLSSAACIDHRSSTTSNSQDPSCLFWGADECSDPPVQYPEIPHARWDEDACWRDGTNIQTGLWFKKHIEMVEVLVDCYHNDQLYFFPKVKTWFQNRRMKLKRHQRDSSWMTERYVANAVPSTPAPHTQVSLASCRYM